MEIFGYNIWDYIFTDRIGKKIDLLPKKIRKDVNSWFKEKKENFAKVLQDSQCKLVIKKVEKSF